MAVSRPQTLVRNWCSCLGPLLVGHSGFCLLTSSALLLLLSFHLLVPVAPVMVLPPSASRSSSPTSPLPRAAAEILTSL